MSQSLKLYKPLRLDKNVEVEGNIFAAPLAGYTDRAFRTVCTEQGADLCYTEMVSCEALVRGSGKTEDLLQKSEAEKIYAVQIFSGTASAAGEAVGMVSRFKPILIDLNCGCPVPKIIKSGAGSDLMRHPDRIAEIVRAMKDNTDIPITVKIRTGWDALSLNYLEAAERAVKAGASLVTMHARTKSQAYGGSADWSHLKKLKEVLGNIPVVGSGDLFTPEAVEAMLQQTGIDGVMLARGVIGNPFLFRETRHYLLTGEILPGPSPYEKMEMAFRQLSLAVHYKDERTAVNEMKKQLCAYTKGLPGSSEIRNKMVHSEDFETYKKIFREYLESFS
ncbi:tRNA dihydrouridine synthase DusB [Oceanispirochaeta sp.]|jgi:tRNA-dihydrouridine synthase B|uniref:tRNA dihydrouridine synthase DusB n=1 Tax=Oceanispirochaeta sp. TaxID=2035350 RepID=UPI002616D8E7|nr:tRNA dihydrouridine synthase DusB [Oceanispirochaeta sp.]MDA3956407.1 tRNA dihydrouridine synthase DusB [Oceanispirochaeta sp.]